MRTSHPPEVKADKTGNAADTDQKTPASINIRDRSRSGLYWVLVNSDYDE